MARGYPDYFGMPIFPSYGAMVDVGETDAVFPDAGDTFAIDVGDKGSLRFGWIHFTLINDLPASVAMALYLDGSTPGSTTLENLYDFNAIDHPHKGLFLTRYNRESKMYHVIFDREINFGQTFRVRIANLTGANIAYLCYASYAKVL